MTGPPRSPAQRGSARCRAGADRGSIAPLVPILMLALFLLGGLLVDGSRDLNARGNAQAFAEEAARAGATAVDLTQSTLTLDPREATRRVLAYCSAITKDMHADVTVTSCGLADPAFTAAGVCGRATSDVVVNTEVTLQVRTTLLGMIGVSEFSVTGRAKARPYEGTNAQNAC